MLAYARHHRLSRPPEHRSEILLAGLELEVLSESNLAQPFPQHAVHAVRQWETGCTEQLRITKEAALLIHEVVSCDLFTDVAVLKNRPKVLLDYPLEPRQYRSDRDYTIPAQIDMAVCGIGNAVTSASPVIEHELRSLCTGSESAIIVEKLHIDHPTATLLQVMLQPPECDDHVSELLPQSNVRDLHLELPLLPMMKTDPHTRKCMNPVLRESLFQNIPDLTKEDTDTLIRENFDDSSPLIKEITNLPDADPPIVTLEPKTVLEIDMPLTPRIMSYSEVRTNNFNKLMHASKDFDTFAQTETTSSPTNLYSIFGIDDSECQDLVLQEQLELFNTALRIPEPRLGSYVRRPDLTNFPSNCSDLVHSRLRPESNSMVSILPAKHLDIDVRWAPFSGKVDPIIELETLVGEEIVEDFVNVESTKNMDDPFAALAEIDAAAVDLTTSGTLYPRILEQNNCPNDSAIQSDSREPFSENEITSMTLGRDARSVVQISSPPFSSPGEAQLVYGEAYGLSGLHEQEGSIYDDATVQNVRLPYELEIDQLGHDHVGARQPLHASIAECKNGEFQDEIEASPQIASQGQALEVEPFYHIISDTSSSDDSLAQVLRDRKRNFRDETVWTERKRTHIGSNLTDFMRLRSNQGPETVLRQEPDPVKTQLRPDQSVILDQPQPVMVIAPDCEPFQRPTQTHLYVISTTLLQRPILWRQLKSQNPCLSLIERDLDTTQEVELICSPSSGILFLTIDDVRQVSLDSVLYCLSQLRVKNCIRKYEALTAIITYTSTLTGDDVVALGTFQGWLSSISGATKINVVALASEEEQGKYLTYCAARYTHEEGAIHRPLPVSETYHELFLRSCPMLNAIQAQLILTKYTLAQFLQLDYEEMCSLLQDLGVKQSTRSVAVYTFFKGDWHAMMAEGSVGAQEYDFVDGNLID